ncbi:MAG: alpha/beta fold hydrolase [Pseudomonadota bacterium]
MTEIHELTGPSKAPASGGKAKQLVVFLHGVGADGNDLIGLAPQLAPILPDTEFLAPDAPFPCDMAPFGRQWFSLQDRSPAAMLAGVRSVAPSVNAFLDRELEKRDLTPDKLILVGFSQGTMTSLYTAPRRPEPIAGVIGFSGALVGAELLADEVKSKPPILLIHGDADEVVPVAAFDNAGHALQTAGFTVYGAKRPGLGHGIDGEGLSMGASFLLDRFGLKPPAAA